MKNNGGNREMLGNKKIDAVRDITDTAANIWEIKYCAQE